MAYSIVVKKRKFWIGEEDYVVGCAAPGSGGEGVKRGEIGRAEIAMKVHNQIVLGYSRGHYCSCGRFEAETTSLYLH